MKLAIVALSIAALAGAGCARSEARSEGSAAAGRASQDGGLWEGTPIFTDADPGSCGGRGCWVAIRYVEPTARSTGARWTGQAFEEEIDVSGRYRTRFEWVSPRAIPARRVLRTDRMFALT